MAMVFIAAPPLGTSLQWAGQGQGRRVLFNFVDWPRKKIEDSWILFTYIPLLQLDCLQKNRIALPPCSPPVEPPFLSLLCVVPMYFWLVVVCKYSKATI